MSREDTYYACALATGKMALYFDRELEKPASRHHVEINYTSAEWHQGHLILAAASRNYVHDADGVVQLYGDEVIEFVLEVRYRTSQRIRTVCVAIDSL